MFEDNLAEIESLAREQELDFFPTSFEVVPQDIMTEMAAYGLPTRARHWSYGKVYQSQRLYGTMGLSKIYEIVLNNDPSLAFLLDSNSDITNLLVAAHVFGHTDFFKNNVMFAPTNRNMINATAANALRIDGYIERYGLETVEHLMDIGFALDRHIDPYLGENRERYPERRVVEHENYADPYADLFDEKSRSIDYVVEYDKLPPHPERDLLWFLINYAPLELWQRDVLQIIREESYYFYPQFLTKILNEGWASYWHAELFYQWPRVKPDEMIEFARTHASVVNPGSRHSVNPYFLGYSLLIDIEKRWDQMFVDGESKITGRQKLFEVRSAEDDISFLRNYLTIEMVEKLELYSYGQQNADPTKPSASQSKDITITSRERDAVVEALLIPRYNYGVPQIVVKDVVKNELYLEHLNREVSFLDRSYAHHTLAYMSELWKHKVYILTNDEQSQETSLTAE